MKKILLLILAASIIISIDNNKIFSFFASEEQEIIAEINGENVTFTDVESLYDMRYAHTPMDIPSVTQLQLEYADLLYKRIEQILITQELEERELSVSDERVDAFEALMRKDYKDLEEYQNITFAQIIENFGMSYPFWKSQLKVRLEIETLQNDIAKNILVDSKEVIQYIADHPELAELPDKFDFIVITSPEKAQLEEIKNKKIHDVDEIEELGPSVRRALFNLPQVPKEYLEDLQKMTSNDFSEIRSEKKNFYLLYLYVYEKNQNLDPLHLYAVAEKELLESKIPSAYDEWFTNSLKNAEITIADDFLPENLPSEVLSESIQSILQENLKLTENKNADSETSSPKEKD